MVLAHTHRSVMPGVMVIAYESVCAQKKITKTYVWMPGQHLAARGYSSLLATRPGAASEETQGSQKGSGGAEGKWSFLSLAACAEVSFWRSKWCS